MTSANCQENQCSISKCDIFDFMAKHVGLKVIHPGGLKATQRLLDFLNLGKNANVIDIACGKGTTALYISEKYGCSVTGIDISEELVEEARYLNKKSGLEKKVTFEVGDALRLPFYDNQFDAAVSQAMLILVEDKIQNIKETNRVLKAGGRAGWLELSWRKDIDSEFLEKVSNVLCAYCMINVETYSEWEETFRTAGINNISTIRCKDFRGNNFDTLKDEGLINTLKIAFKTIRNSEIRDRIRLMNKFFREYDDYFGYGIYYYSKQ